MAVFDEDEEIPIVLVAFLWRATAGIDQLQSSQLCVRLRSLALVSTPDGHQDSISLHDVVRSYLGQQIGRQRFGELHRQLVDAAAGEVAVAARLTPDDTIPAIHAWWEMKVQSRYLWDNLIAHLLAGGRESAAGAAAADLRWLGARLERFGVGAAYADLALVQTPHAARLRKVLARTTHLLAPTEPERAVVDILHSRVADDPFWGPQVTALRGGAGDHPRLVARHPPPDLPGEPLQQVLTGHHGSVTDVAISADGRWLATSGYDHTVRIWDARDGNLRATFTGPAAVKALMISPDGTWLATLNDGTGVRVLDAATGEVRAALSGWTRSASISPDGSLLVTVGYDGTLQLWDTDSWSLRRTVVGKRDKLHLQDAVISPDGTWLAVTNIVHEVTVFGVDRGDVIAVLRGHTKEISEVAICPDGSWLATASQDETVRIWSTETWATLRVLAGHAGGVRAVAISSSGDWLATGGHDNTAWIWDSKTGSNTATLTGHSDTVSAVAISPDDGWLTTASWDATVRIWNIGAERAEESRENYARGVTATATSSDGSWIGTGSDDGTVRVLDAGTARARAVFTGHASPVTVVAISPDRRWLATGTTRGDVRIWDVETGECHPVVAGHTDCVTAMAISPDGTRLVTGSRDATARIWELRNGRTLAVLEDHSWGINAVAFSPDGTWLASCGDDHATRLWDADTGHVRLVLKRHTGDVRSLAISSDSTWLATGGLDASVRTWDARSGQQRLVLDGHSSPVQVRSITGLVISSDRTWVASGSTGGVLISDAVSGETRAAITGRLKDVTAISVSPNGQWLAITSEDGAIRIADTAYWRIQAMMRLDNRAQTCEWFPDSTALTVTGPIGLYIFDFLAGRPAPA
jgi:WD40 repeat protein